ncbi:hypothetical protein ACQ4WP_26160 [Janthinobacterium sp. GB4P2]|uniref:hypothetical protein n=1 Tax=Janthinobacterium sp. GB4P2 TaxID=3424189 RepID=UPI003F1EDB84
MSVTESYKKPTLTPFMAEELISAAQERRAALLVMLGDKSLPFYIAANLKMRREALLNSIRELS